MNFVIKTPSRRVFEVINALLLLAFGIICLLPVWHVIMSSFSDPNDTDPWEDQRIMRTLRLCDTYNVPCATNLASAEMLILGLQRGDLDWRMMMKNKKSIR